MKSKVSTFLYLVLLICFSAGFAMAQGTHKPVRLGSSAAPYGYYEYLPTNFSKSSGKFPLLIFLHGAGEKGNGKDQLDRAVKFGPGREIDRGKNFPFVVLSPQTRDWWNSKELNDFIDYAIKNYNIDPNRIYMTGLSMGAMGTFAYAASYPDKLAAMVGIAGSADNSKVCRYSHVPLWAFHGDQDPTVSVNGSKNLVAAYNRCSPSPSVKAKLTIMPGQKHWGWNDVYNGSKGDIYGWMLQFSKNGSKTVEKEESKPNKAPIVNAGSDRSVTLPLAELTLSGSAKDEDGSIQSYSWRKISGPGVEMNGANTNSLKLRKLEKGAYVFQLTAKDNSGASASDDIRLEVKAAPSNGGGEKQKKPSASVTANAGGNRTITLPVKKETLSGSAKFVNSSASSYKWEKVSGPSVKMGGSGANLVLTQLNAGEYVFRFTAGNSAGQFDSDDMKLTVLKGKVASSGADKPKTETSSPNPSGNEDGLVYSYYTIDPKSRLTKLPDFRKLKPAKTGRVKNFDLSPAQRSDHFAMVFEGYLKIDRAGDYFFYTRSDDGSKLYINDKLVVNNDGLHAPEVKYNRIKLSSGSHKIKVEYFENQGDERLFVAYKGPGVRQQEIPANRLSTGKGYAPAPEQSGDGGLNYAYFENNDSRNRWYKLPDFNRLSPKKTGTVADFSLAPAQRNSHFGLVFEGQIRIDKAGDYTFFTNSDDGSQLFINGKRVVDNDGWHAPQERSGRIKLSAGHHSIRVVFYEHEGEEVLEVKWQGPGIRKQTIPSSVLSPGSNSFARQQNTLAGNEAFESDFVEGAETAGLSLYPNPAREQLHLKLGSADQEAVTVSILDLGGRELYQAEHQTAGTSRLSLDLQALGLQKGAYLMRVQDVQSRAVRTFRFIKE